MRPTQVDALIADADIVIDATGNAALTDALSIRTNVAGRPLVSGALYRGGRIGRVRRHATPDDTPYQQRQPPRYPFIPRGSEEDVARAAVGCSAPVHNAPPSAVLACAALLAQVTIDVLMGRLDLPDEVIDVYRPLPGEPPFDRVGRLTAA